MRDHPRSISIFGSCVTRDCFRGAYANQFSIENYIARESVVSAIAEPCPLRQEEIHLESPFQKMAVWRDFKKTAFETLFTDKSEYLLIDLIDERLSVVKQGGTYVTKSNEAVNAGVIADDAEVCRLIFQQGDYYRGEVNIRRALEEFCRRVKSKYPENKIVLHKAMCVSEYRSKNNELCEYPPHQIAFGKTVNKLLEYMYGILQEQMPRMHVIDKMSGVYGSETHVWGLSIVHYEDWYYEEVVRELKRILEREEAASVQ